MKSMTDLPEPAKRALIDNAKGMRDARASGDQLQIAMCFLGAVAGVLAAMPEFWTVVDALADGDLSKADEILA